MTDFPIKVPVTPVQQNIGTFYVGCMPYQEALAISSTDRRHFDESKGDFIGVQRPLKKERVKAIAEFLQSDDASFPTSIIFALDERCVDVEFREEDGFAYLVIQPSQDVDVDEIAKIIDGQHRLAGLKAAGLESFSVSCSFFVGADATDQAIIFASVNLNQSRINRSQAYDLLAFATERSPERVLHDIIVALDKNENSPFQGMIKRLGVATPKRDGETITQAAFFDGLLGYLTDDAVADRNAARSGKSWPKISDDRSRKVIFRELFELGDDALIYGNIARFYAAVRQRWPKAWGASATGNSILVKTTGFLALCRFLRDVYISTGERKLDRELCVEIFERVLLDDSDFIAEKFPSGSVGQRLLYERLKSDSNI